MATRKAGKKKGAKRRSKSKKLPSLTECRKAVRHYQESKKLGDMEYALCNSIVGSLRKLGA